MVLSHKLLLCAGVLAAILLASPASAEEAETAKKCPEGEEQDDQEEAACCKPIMMEDTEDGKLCMTPPSEISLATAITLILSFTFLISLQCFLRHSHVGMREHAYKGINLTVSIFIAVLFFQSLNGFIESYISVPLQKATGWGRVAYRTVSLIHMLLWYCITQVVIAKVSRAFESSERRRSVGKLESRDQDERAVILDVEIKGVCYGMVLAHLTGFAAVQFWTELQQIEFVKTSVLWTVALPFIALLLQFLFERVTALVRAQFMSPIEDRDFFENAWDEKCQHAEDDIMGLTVSIMMVNSLRYAVNAYYGHQCLPNSEQKEEGLACEYHHSAWHALWLFVFGWLFVLLLFVTKLFLLKSEETDESEEEDEIKRTKSSMLLYDTIAKMDSTNFWKQVKERLKDVSLNIWSMAYAWCIFHGAHQLAQTIGPELLTQEEHATSLSVALAFSGSYMAFLVIRIIAHVADCSAEWTPTWVDHEEVSSGIKEVILGTSLFVGFAWEQTFEVSIDQVAERTRKDYGEYAPPFVKLLICCACLGVVFFSWKWYILPYVFKKGWRVGDVFSRHDLLQVCDDLAKYDQAFSKDDLKNLAHNLAKKTNLPHAHTRFERDDDASWDQWANPRDLEEPLLEKTSPLKETIQESRQQIVPAMWLSPEKVSTPHGGTTPTTFVSTQFASNWAARSAEATPIKTTMKEEVRGLTSCMPPSSLRGCSQPRSKTVPLGEVLNVIGCMDSLDEATKNQISSALTHQFTQDAVGDDSDASLHNVNCCRLPANSPMRHPRNQEQKYFTKTRASIERLGRPAPVEHEVAERKLDRVQFRDRLAIFTIADNFRPQGLDSVACANNV